MSELEVARSLQFLHLYICQQWYSARIVPALGRLKTESCEFETSLGCRERDLALEETKVQNK